MHGQNRSTPRKLFEEPGLQLYNSEPHFFLLAIINDFSKGHLTEAKNMTQSKALLPESLILF